MRDAKPQVRIGPRYPMLQKVMYGMLGYIAIIGGGLASVELRRDFREYDSMEIITLNAYAFSIGVCGIGVLCSGLVIRALLRRIEALESTLKELSGG